MTKGRHKVADLKLKPESYTKPSTLSLAPPLRQVKGREESGEELVTKPASTTATKPNWRAKMLDARAARKANDKLGRLRALKEKSTSKIQRLERELAALEESFSKEQEPMQPTSTSWFAPALSRPLS